MFLLFQQNRHTDILPKLCNECLLQVCKATLDNQEVILVLASVGRGFCSYLNYNVITSTSLQHIMHAEDDGEALYHIRMVSWETFYFIINILGITVP